MNSDNVTSHRVSDDVWWWSESLIQSPNREDQEIDSWGHNKNQLSTRQQWLQSTGCSNGIAHPGMPHVAVFMWVGVVSTKCLDVTDGSSNIIRWLLTNSFGWALTPVLPMVVFVPFNHMTTLALVQLGIRNNHLEQSFLKRSLRELQRAQGRTAWRTESRGHSIGLGKLIWCYQTNRIQSLKPSGLEYLYFYRGRGHP